jgi:hypothetical protein
VHKEGTNTQSREWKHGASFLEEAVNVVILADRVWTSQLTMCCSEDPHEHNSSGTKQDCMYEELQTVIYVVM